MKKISLQAQIPLSIFKEGDQFIAYTPALDLSTVGDTFEQAQHRFAEAVEIFFAEVAERGLLEDTLQDLGWEKTKNQWMPPLEVAHSTELIQMPAFA